MAGETIPRVQCGDLRNAVQTFLSGTWVERSARLIIAIQAETADTKLQKAVERQATELRAIGVTLLLLGADELAARLKAEPEIVDDFFGRRWAEAFTAKRHETCGGGWTAGSSPGCALN